jgi:hypothetical protein
MRRAGCAKREGLFIGSQELALPVKQVHVEHVLDGGQKYDTRYSEHRTQERQICHTGIAHLLTDLVTPHREIADTWHLLGVAKTRSFAGVEPRRSFGGRPVQDDSSRCRGRGLHVH